MASRTPVHWLLLVHDKKRLALSVMGIAFAVFVMFMEVGFFNGLNDSQTLLPTRVKADLVMMSKKKTHLNKFNKFWLANLHRMLAHPEVEQVLPLYDGSAQIKNRGTGLYNVITVLAFPVGGDPLAVKGLDRGRELLRNSKVVIFDAKSRAIYGDIRPGQLVEIDGVKYEVGGLAELGANFSRNGYLFMNSPAWLTHPMAGRPERPDFGLIWLKPGVHPEAFARLIAPQLPEEVELLTPEQIRRREADFITYQTPVGIIFGIGLVVGFIIGVIICYQVLFNEINDHLPQYATLRAMGYPNRYLTGLVLKASLLLSLLGFLPGLILAWLFYQAIDAHSGIVMLLTWDRAALVLSLNVLMCALAGALAARKVLQADPADLF